jgi:hypothetical protein
MGSERAVGALAVESSPLARACLTGLLMRSTIGVLYAPLIDKDMEWLVLGT